MYHVEGNEVLLALGKLPHSLMETFLVTSGSTSSPAVIEKSSDSYLSRLWSDDSAKLAKTASILVKSDINILSIRGEYKGLFPGLQEP